MNRTDSTTAARSPVPKRQRILTRVGLAAVIVAAAWLRYTSASQDPLEEIEYYEYIPAAMTLSLDHHPIRLLQHGPVPPYLVRTSGLLFGETDLGFRMLSVIAGTATIALLYVIAARWWGSLAGLFAAMLLCVERYHVTISGRAIDLPFDLFFIAIAMYCFSRFLQVTDVEPEAKRSARWLYATSIACGLGFLTKELTALMVPVLGLSLLTTSRTRWFRRRALWLAVLLYGLVVSPDVYSSVTTTHADRTDLLARQVAAIHARGLILEDSAEVTDGYFMSYGDHLSRFRSVGFNAEPFYLYFGEILEGFRVVNRNAFDEFPYMNPVLGAVLWMGVAAAAARQKDSLTRFLLTMFFGMFVPFTMVRMGAPRGTFPSDPQMLWYWVDRTMLPALLLTGHVMATLASGFVARRSARK